MRSSAILKDILYGDDKTKDGGIKLKKMAEQGLNENIWLTGNKSKEDLEAEQAKYNEKLTKSLGLTELFA